MKGKRFTTEEKIRMLEPALHPQRLAPSQTNFFATASRAPLDTRPRSLSRPPAYRPFPSRAI